jgi:tetratricopeptide (TPR) repeat protein
MFRLVRRKRNVFWFAVAGVALLGAVAAFRWVKPRLFPEPTAEASAAYSRGDWERTSLLAHRRLKQVPEDPKALRLAARAAAHQDRDQSAIAIYSRLDVAMMDPEDFFLMGRALSQTGQIEAATKAFETALAGNPDHPPTLDFLCRIYYQTNRYFAAEEAAERLARQPDWEARARLMLGNARLELEDPRGVAEALRRWLELDPEGRAALPDPVRTYQMLLARSLLKSRQPAEARRLLQPILDQGPDSEASWLLTRSYIQERDWGRAEAVSRQDPSYRTEHPLEPEPAHYIGEARCAECHRAESEAVLASRHATTFALARDLSRLPLPKVPLVDPGNPHVTHQFQHEGDTLNLETRTGEPVFRAVVDYAFGSLDHFMTFVGRDDHDRSFMLRMSAYDSPKGLAWDVATGLVARPADPEEYLGKKMDQRDGVRRCLFCHTTNFRAVMNQVGPEAADHSIGCEKCHGPGGHHVAAVDAGFNDLAMGSPGKAPASAVNQICGQCHGFPQPELLSASRTDPALYRFQSVSLTWSRCDSESNGRLSCVTCHDPHRNVETSTSLNEARCLSCHAADPGPATAASAALSVGRRRPDPSQQGTQSPREPNTPCPVNPAKGCLECHMPRAWQKETHSFKTDHFIRVRDQPDSGK